MDDELGPLSRDDIPFGSSWRKWAARRATPTRVRELTIGQRGHVVGRALPWREPLVAPLSGRACLFWRVQIRRKDELIVDAASELRFVLEDDAKDKLVVDPERAVVDVALRPIDEESLHPTDEGRRLLAHAAVGAMSCFEARIVEGVLAGAWGIVTAVATVHDAGYRDAPHTTKRIGSTPIDRAVVHD